MAELKHKYGHSTYSDIRKILQCNKIWSVDMQRYLGENKRRFTTCVASYTLLISRMVAMSSSNRKLNDVVTINHFYLNQMRPFHCMAVLICIFGTICYCFSATVAFETTYIAQCWPPFAVQGDQSFEKRKFLDYLDPQGTIFHPVPSRNNQKNNVEPKNGAIISIFIRLTHASPGSSKAILAFRAVRISNYLYCLLHNVVILDSKGMYKARN